MIFAYQECLGSELVIKGYSGLLSVLIFNEFSNKFWGPVKPAAIEPMVSFMSQLHTNARRRRKFLRILAHRMFWKRFGNKGL